MFTKHIFRLEIKLLVERVVAGNSVPDDTLLKALGGGNLLEILGGGNWNDVRDNEEFFRKCLTGRLPQSAKFMIKKDKDNNQLEKELSAREKPSIIFEAQEEEVIIEIMKTYTKESWKSKSVIPETQENLLHFLISKRFEKALSEMFANKSIQEDVRELWFQPTIFQKIPFKYILGQGMEDAAIKLWKFMEIPEENLEDEANDIKLKLEETVSKKNESDESIFHICSYVGQNKLLAAICNSPRLSQKCIQVALANELNKPLFVHEREAHEDLVMVFSAH